METEYPIGILGLGVMGRSLALNFQHRGDPPIGFDPVPRLPLGDPANLIQAQRDYFGAHTDRRADREGIFHTHRGAATI